jgi:putative molybdopterin biosynthesis protein
MHNYLNNIELEIALETFLSENLHKLDIEEIDTSDSYGRITAEAIYAKISSPHYNACAMDGISVKSSSTFGATESDPIILKENTDYKRVDTGDSLPRGYDAVVMIEDCIAIEENKIKLISAATPWQHVRQIGEDVCANEMLVPSYTKMEPATIGAFLAGGVLEFKALKLPVVGIIPTGDEIVSPCNSPKDGEIIEFNSSVFSAMLSSWGVKSIKYPISKDNLENIKSAITKALKECDIVIVNAGSSAGRDDYTASAIAQVGKLILHGIAIKPGKPTILGIADGKAVIGVPGYPVSGIIVMENIVRPILEHLLYIDLSNKKTTTAILSRKIIASLKYKEFVRVRLGMVEDKLIATPLNRGAGVVTSFVKADGILEIPLNCEGIEAGQEVNISLIKSEQAIKNTLVITGSHDPLLDVVADEFARQYKGYSVASSNVGSLGGIMAVKRKECHLAGTHLLDVNTGEYNLTYINKYLANDDVAIIKCVKRLQGLIIPKNNPKNIKNLDILKDETIRFANRQNGSGTRILFDYLLNQNNISSNQINGYVREEFTHLAITALVASGDIDVGMGVFSAAKIYDLDFVPLYEEEYDFIVPKKFLELDIMKKFVNVLKSQEFSYALNNLGGYILNVGV